MFVGFLVQAYKWVEFQVFQLFRSRLERYILKTYAPLGVVFEVDSAENSNNNAVSDKLVDEEYIKKESQFESILRVKVHDKVFFTRIANVASLGMGGTKLKPCVHIK